MKKYVRVDENGMYVEDVLLDEDYVQHYISQGRKTMGYDEDTLVLIDVPQGFYHPKWDFTNEQWIEGLTQAEIDAIKNTPQPPSAIDILGQQIVQKDLQILQLQQQNQTLGEQIVAMDLRLLAVEGGGSA